MTTGDLIREARKKAKITQEELANILGVSYTLISQYERGIRNPKAETLQKIAVALDVTVGSLKGGSFSILDLTTPAINYVKITKLSEEYRTNIERVIKITEAMSADVLRALVNVLDGATDDEIDQIITHGLNLRGIPILAPKHSSFSLSKEKPDSDTE